MKTQASLNILQFCLTLGKERLSCFSTCDSMISKQHPYVRRIEIFEKFTSACLSKLHSWWKTYYSYIDSTIFTLFCPDKVCDWLSHREDLSCCPPFLK